MQKEQEEIKIQKNRMSQALSDQFAKWFIHQFRHTLEKTKRMSISFNENRLLNIISETLFSQFENLPTDYGFLDFEKMPGCRNRDKVRNAMGSIKASICSKRQVKNDFT